MPTVEGAAFILRVVGWGLVAIVAHELAHAVAAVVVGRRIQRVDWRSLDVYWRVPAAGPHARDYFVGWAPMLSGALIALTAALTALSLTVPQWVALAFYALHGGLGDLTVTTTHQPDASGAGKT